MALPQTQARTQGSDDLKQLVDDCLRQAQKAGASQAEAGASLDSGFTVTVRMREVETIESQRDRGLGVTVWFGHRKGSASTTDFGPKAVAETVKKACTIARFTAEDEFTGLADADLMATDFPELDLYHRWAIAPSDAIELATECEAAALDFDPRIGNSEGASVSTHTGERVYGNTHGFMGTRRGSNHSISCAVIAGHSKEMQRDYWYTSMRDPAELMDRHELGRIAARRAVDRLGARKIDTCRAPVVFPAHLARGLIANLVAAVRGTAQYREATFLHRALGKRVMAEHIRIRELPHLPKASASAAFDQEGVGTRERDLVSGGVLNSYLLSSYSARKLGMQSTGNAGGVHNLQLEPGSCDFSELIREMGRGLIVCELIGQGVNIVNGDYSRGAAGFWVEDGEIRFPVQEITIAGNLKQMFEDIAVVGNDLDTRSSIRTPSLLLSEMTIAGN